MISIVYMSVLEEASPAVEYAERLRPLPSARHSSAVFNFSPGLGRGLVCFLLHVALCLPRSGINLCPTCCLRPPACSPYTLLLAALHPVRYHGVLLKQLRPPRQLPKP